MVQQIWKFINLVLVIISRQQNIFYIHVFKFSFEEFMDEKSVKLMDTSKMLSELLDLFQLQYNFSFLEWIFEKCGENDLVKKCQKFSSENQFQLECFRTKIVPRKQFVSEVKQFVF